MKEKNIQQSGFRALSSEEITAVSGGEIVVTGGRTQQPSSPLRIPSNFSGGGGTSFGPTISDGSALEGGEIVVTATLAEEDNSFEIVVTGSPLFLFDTTAELIFRQWFETVYDGFGSGRGIDNATLVIGDDFFLIFEGDTGLLFKNTGLFFADFKLVGPVDITNFSINNSSGSGVDFSKTGGGGSITGSSGFTVDFTPSPNR